MSLSSAAWSPLLHASSRPVTCSGGACVISPFLLDHVSSSPKNITPVAGLVVFPLLFSRGSPAIVDVDFFYHQSPVAALLHIPPITYILYECIANTRPSGRAPTRDRSSDVLS